MAAKNKRISPEASGPSGLTKWRYLGILEKMVFNLYNPEEENV
ncbi:MAG: hypothetical protein V4589_05500 [Bacteroidota bacterium]